MIEDCVIIGGGVAGLSAANQLADAGMSPLIIDGGEFPCHRMCGEYFSHESLPILQKWDIPMTGQINQVRFIKGTKKVQFSLPISAASCSRYEFDVKLYNRALNHGARALCKTTVQSLEASEKCYELQLSDGQLIQARHLIIGTGKLPKAAGLKADVPQMKYAGFKAHFEGIVMDDSIEMHTFPGGYLGMAKINPSTTNIAVLVNKDLLTSYDQPALLLKKYTDEKLMPIFKERMADARMIFPKWIAAQVPEFGIRHNPDWERVFWVGDAAGGIPPVSGEGLAIAVTSGCMAADYLLKEDSKQFRKDWMARYHKRYFWAQRIHQVLTRPWLNEISLRVFRVFPSLPLRLWQLTREQSQP